MEGRMYVRVADWQAQPGYQPGDDPDSFIRREGPAAFQRLIDSALPAGEWTITQAERALPSFADAFERSALVNRLLEVVRREPDPIVRAHYRRRIAQVGQVDEATIARMVGDPIPFRRRLPRYTGGVSFEYGGTGG